MTSSPEASGRPIAVFFSYAHRDEALRNELADHLRLLERQGIITSWHDRRLAGGTEWAGAIDEHLHTAQIILLLISAAFLASDYCYDVELRQALDRHEAGKARVIPVILRPVEWHSAPFGMLQALPKDGRAVTSWPNPDEAFADIAHGIRSVAEELGRNPCVPHLQPHLPGAQIDPLPSLRHKQRLRETMRYIPMQVRALMTIPSEDAPWDHQQHELCDATLTLLHQHSWVVLIGEAGSGKTVGLRAIEAAIADCLCSDGQEINQSSGAHLGYPMFCDLRDLDLTQLSPVEAIEKVVMAELQHEGLLGTGDATAGMRKFVQQYGLVLLGDGLNQLAPHVRVQSVQGLESFVQRSPFVRVVVATRPLVAGTPEAYPTLVISAIARSNVGTFLQRYGVAPDLVPELQHTMEEHPGLRPLVGRPFFLSLLAQVISESQSVPKDPYRLLQAFVEQTLSKVVHNTADIRREDLIQALRVLAETITIPGHQLPRQAALHALHTTPTREPHSVEVFLEYLVASGLVTMSRDFVRFQHQNFHEFFLADAASLRCLAATETATFGLDATRTAKQEFRRLLQRYNRQGEPWGRILQLFAMQAERASVIRWAKRWMRRRPDLAALLVHGMGELPHDIATNMLRRTSRQLQKGVLHRWGWDKRLLGLYTLLCLIFSLWTTWYSFFGIQNNAPDAQLSPELPYIVVFITLGTLGVVLPSVLYILGQSFNRRKKQQAIRALSALTTLGSEAAIGCLHDIAQRLRTKVTDDRQLRGMTLAVANGFDRLDEQAACADLDAGRFRYKRLIQLRYAGTPVAIPAIKRCLEVGVPPNILCAALDALAEIRNRYPEYQGDIDEGVRQVVYSEGYVHCRYKARKLLARWGSKTEGLIQVIRETTLGILAAFLSYIIYTYIMVVFSNLFYIPLDIIEGRGLLYSIQDSLYLFRQKELGIIGSCMAYMSLISILPMISATIREIITFFPRPISYMSLLSDFFILPGIPICFLLRKFIPQKISASQFECIIAWFYMIRKEPNKCEESAQRAMHDFYSPLSNILRTWVFACTGLAHFRRGSEENAIRWFEQAIENTTSYWQYKNLIERYPHLIVRIPLVRRQRREAYKALCILLLEKYLDSGQY
jgi:hypothetical protein